MKNLTNGCIYALLMCLVLVSCSPDPTKKLAKTWTVNDMETAADLQDSVKSRILMGSEMMFTKDGQYSTSGGIGADQGTYTVDKDGKNLSTTSAAGKGSAVYEIEKLSDDRLVLINNGNTVTCTAKN